MKLDIIVNLFNNEKQISSCYEKIVNELKSIKYNIIFVDNGSTDNTLLLLKELYKNNYENIKIVSLSKKFEMINAYIAGLKYSNAEYVCFYDIKQSASYISKMLSQLEEHKDYDSICMCNKIENIKFIDKIMLKSIKKHNYNCIEGQTYYRMFNKKMRDSIIKYADKYDMNFIKFNNLGFNVFYDKFKSNESKIDNNYIFNIFNYYLNMSLPNLYFGLLNIIISILYLLISLLLKNMNIIILLLFLVNGINFIFLSFIIKDKKNKEINYLIKEVIGFDENYL